MLYGPLQFQGEPSELLDVYTEADVDIYLIFGQQ